MTKDHHLMRSLKSRSDRLVQLLNLDAPEAILCHAIALVFKSGMAAFPKELGKSFGDIVCMAIRNWHGYCETCPAEVEPGQSHCKACQLKADQEMARWKEEI